MLGAYLTFACLQAGSVYALDPNKHRTQYMHTSWRLQDGSAPAGMFSITQTSGGFLWFSSLSQGMYRFDGVRLVPLTLPGSSSSSDTILNVFGDHGGGLWVIGQRQIAHLRNGVVTSDFDLQGLEFPADVSEDPDGSLWIERGKNSVSE